MEIRENFETYLYVYIRMYMKETNDLVQSPSKEEFSIKTACEMMSTRKIIEDNQDLLFDEV